MDYGIDKAKDVFGIAAGRAGIVSKSGQTQKKIVKKKTGFFALAVLAMAFAASPLIAQIHNAPTILKFDALDSNGWIVYNTNAMGDYNNQGVPDENVSIGGNDTSSQNNLIDQNTAENIQDQNVSIDQNALENINDWNAGQKIESVPASLNLGFSVRTVDGEEIGHRLVKIEKNANSLPAGMQKAQIAQDLNEITPLSQGTGTAVETQQTYSIGLEIDDNCLKKVELDGALLEKDANLLEIRLLHDTVTEKGTKLKNLFLFNPLVGFDGGSISFVAPENTNALLKCGQWNSETENCDENWQAVLAFKGTGQLLSIPITKEDPVFGFAEIPITKAVHLDENRNPLADIFEETRQKDNVWSEAIPAGHFVRASFATPLDNSKDITIYARSIDGNASIEVYTEDGNEVIANFENIGEENWHKIYLTALPEGESYSTFDLKVLGSAVEFDYIVDPTAVILNSATGSTCTTVCTNNGYTSCTSVGTDAGGTNGKAWFRTPGCQEVLSNTCSTSMPDVLLTCGDHAAAWTNCLCFSDSCTCPASGSWSIVNGDTCNLSTTCNLSAGSDFVIENGSLTILSTGTLVVPAGGKAAVKAGSKLVVETGGKLVLRKS